MNLQAFAFYVSLIALFSFWLNYESLGPTWIYLKVEQLKTIVLRFYTLAKMETEILAITVDKGRYTEFARVFCEENGIDMPES
jgi:hypothetical protein